jgi:hypothetical protein
VLGPQRGLDPGRSRRHRADQRVEIEPRQGAVVGAHAELALGHRLERQQGKQRRGDRECDHERDCARRDPDQGDRGRDQLALRAQAARNQRR